MLSNRLLLLMAQGLGSGRLPGAPGTWGSVVGLFWFILLAGTGHPLVYAAGTLFLLVVAVPVCARAEQLLGTPDPGSVVLDEMAAVPLCYAGWILCDWLREAATPGWREASACFGCWTRGNPFRSTVARVFREAGGLWRMTW